MATFSSRQSATLTAPGWVDEADSNFYCKRCWDKYEDKYEPEVCRHFPQGRCNSARVRASARWRRPLPPLARRTGCRFLHQRPPEVLLAVRLNRVVTLVLGGQRMGKQTTAKRMKQEKLSAHRQGGQAVVDMAI